MSQDAAADDPSKLAETIDCIDRFSDAIQMAQGYSADRASGGLAWNLHDLLMEHYRRACEVTGAQRSVIERVAGKPTGWLNGLLDEVLLVSTISPARRSAFALKLNKYKRSLLRVRTQATSNPNELVANENDITGASPAAASPAAAANGAGKANKKPKRGGQARYTDAEKRKVTEAWKTGSYRTHADLAATLGFGWNAKKVFNILEAARKRPPKAK